MSAHPDRMPPILPARMTAAQQAAADEIAAGPRGGVVGPFVPAIRSPEFMRRLQRLGEYLRYDTALDPRLRELAILLTSRRWSQQYEWHAHAPVARAAGLAPDVIDAIARGERPASMADDESLVFDLVAALHRDGQVDDALYARAVTALGEQGLVDLVGAAGYYSTLAMLMNVARTPLPEGVEPLLPPVSPRP